MTEHRVSIETIRLALGRLGIGWRRAKHWITSPDPDYVRKKERRDALIALARLCGWVVGYADEVWWSRVAQPKMHSWSEAGQSMCLQELRVNKEDPDPKALCCYGLLEPDSETIRVRFVDGRPVSHVTTATLRVALPRVAEPGPASACPHLG